MQSIKSNLNLKLALSLKKKKYSLKLKFHTFILLKICITFKCIYVMTEKIARS